MQEVVKRRARGKHGQAWPSMVCSLGEGNIFRLGFYVGGVSSKFLKYW